MLTSVTNNTTRQGLITLEAYLSGIECLPPHRPRRSRHYDQALLATIPVLDFTAEEGGTQIAQIPERSISSSHPAIPHDFTNNRADKNAFKTIQIENSSQPYPCKKASLLALRCLPPIVLTMLRPGFLLPKTASVPLTPIYLSSVGPTSIVLR